MKETKSKRPTQLDRLKHLEHAYNHLHAKLEKLTMTASDLQTNLDALTVAVTKVAAEVAALKATPALITQDQLDKATADVQAATATLQAL